jgi:predicted metal-dependent phosphotriesterase family hydrolase
MSFVRTVLGDVAATQLGVCYAHEHVIIDAGFATQATPDFQIDDLARAVAELRQFYADGGRAMIDAMPCDCGRNVRKLAEVARQSGVHIVAPTGLHLAKYYDAGHWGNFYGDDELAELFIADITEGIDAHDYGGPRVRRTAHLAGVIKIATERSFTAREEKVFAAAAQAHQQTGCPILTHTEQGEGALAQVERLRGLGVDLGHVCLSHTDRKPDVGLHRELLATGVRVEFDSAFRWKAGERNGTRELLETLLTEFPDQIMLGMDAARRSYWRSYGGGPGLSFLLTDFSEQLRAAGVSPLQLEKIFVSTPAATFAFKSP